MVEEGFKFDERDYEIKLLWELNQLRKAIVKLVGKSKKYAVDSQKYNEIIGKAKEYSFQYTLFHLELMEFYKA
ncbi:MAG: hypothetical protein IPN14_10815 [Bacteroidetes bacterium]|nr:hypothetical protein [Bacteroidota bacterium]